MPLRQKRNSVGIRKLTFKDLVRIMVDRDLELVDLETPGEGERILEQRGINWTKNQLAKM